MNRVKVKICGITQPRDIAAAVGAGADALGFVVGVPSSPRNLRLDKARQLIEKVPVFIQSVAVTVTNSPSKLASICQKLEPDAVQIHGKNLSDVSAVHDCLGSVRLIKAVHLQSVHDIDVTANASHGFDAVLSDSFVSGKQGGTGTTHDWELSKRLKQAIQPMPLILAGGLKPENVREAIRRVNPYAVDVSSGVESKLGVKDSRKIIEFIENAKDGL